MTRQPEYGAHTNAGYIFVANDDELILETSDDGCKWLYRIRNRRFNKWQVRCEKTFGLNLADVIDMINKEHGTNFGYSPTQSIGYDGVYAYLEIIGDIPSYEELS